MRVRPSIILVAAALVVWTFASYELIGLSSGSHPCTLLVQVPESGSANTVIPPMTQAEMDARTAACSQPRVMDFVIPAAGYVLILGAAVAAATAGKRDTRLGP